MEIPLGDYDPNDRGQTGKEHRRRRASRDFPAVSARAAALGMRLTRNSEHHYTLRAGVYRLDLYPGNLHVYRGAVGNARPLPFLRLPTDWTLLDVIAAVDTLNLTGQKSC